MSQILLLAAATRGTEKAKEGGWVGTRKFVEMTLDEADPGINPDINPKTLLKAEETRQARQWKQNWPTKRRKQGNKTEKVQRMDLMSGWLVYLLLNRNKEQKDRSYSFKNKVTSK